MLTFWGLNNPQLRVFPTLDLCHSHNTIVTIVTVTIGLNSFLIAVLSVPKVKFGELLQSSNLANKELIMHIETRDGTLF